MKTHGDGLTPPLDDRAFALRPVRFTETDDGGEIRHYEAITFPQNPRGGCGMWLRRCLGQLRDEGSNLLIDVLDENGDIIQDYPITRDGFEYLRRSLKFRRVYE